MYYVVFSNFFSLGKIISLYFQDISENLGFIVLLESYSLYSKLYCNNVSYNCKEIKFKNITLLCIIILLIGKCFNTVGILLEASQSDNFKRFLFSF